VVEAALRQWRARDSREKDGKRGLFVIESFLEGIMKKILATGLLLGVLLSPLAMAGSVGATTLADVVVPGLETLIGDKVFSDWEAAISYNLYAAPFTLADITFVPLETPALNPGFQLTGMPLAVQALGLQDLTLSFTVTATGDQWIKDASLGFVGSVLGGASTLASVQIVENIYASKGGALLAHLVVGESGGVFIEFAEATFVAPLKSIYVVKDISLNGDGASGGAAAVSQVTERFSEIPLPPALLLLAPSLFGIAGLRKRYVR